MLQEGWKADGGWDVFPQTQYSDYSPVSRTQVHNAQTPTQIQKKYSH